MGDVTGNNSSVRPLNKALHIILPSKDLCRFWDPSNPASRPCSWSKPRGILGTDLDRRKFDLQQHNKASISESLIAFNTPSKTH